MDTNVIMLLIALGSLVIGGIASLGINYLTQKGKNPQAMLNTANTVISGVETANGVIGELLPGPVESIVDKILKTAQAGVHAAQQLCDSNQLTEDQRKQKAFDSAMNLLKLEGYTPTPELETAVKDAIETGVFVLKSINPKPQVADTTPVAPAQAIQDAVTNAVTQAVSPIAQQAANNAVNQAITQAVSAVQGALAPQAAQTTQAAQTDQPQTQTAQ
ncbi:hypothetical protein REC12_11900 [Desulfosporosinus sp. PR]|uniref:hypothetical protein n=1 Tax=Candidatus Desulfosporosinus nitrosoreducens TaxID=3401928 RepID=UPI0027E77B95|nr:hypothetical protein [Desulfosporosinus sp. PR]MDQ7094293.1 hypothetical protein [Desulfosporosinus sp. PR]